MPELNAAWPPLVASAPSLQTYRMTPHGTLMARLVDEDLDRRRGRTNAAARQETPRSPWLRAGGDSHRRLRLPCVRSANFRRLNWRRNVGFAAGGVGNRCNSAIVALRAYHCRVRGTLRNMPRTMIGLAVTLVFSLVAFTMPTSVWAAGPTLTVSADGGVHIFDRDALLARTDVVEITTSRDVAYHTSRTYRAVALAKLLEGVAIPPDAVVEATAQDGFVTQLPRDLVYANGGIVAYMAIEVADTPWPPIPGKDKSAGPFYIVWLGDQASSVPIMKWPYQVVSLSVQDAPAKRWPSLAVDPMLPALHPARDGQTIFVNKCFTCHTMNQAGSASAGPDLNLPMNPTEYFTEAGLRALIRDPRSVRVWPEQRMPSFAEEDLSDEELGPILSYLSHMAEQRRAEAANAK